MNTRNNSRFGGDPVPSISGRYSVKLNSICSYSFTLESKPSLLSRLLAKAMFGLIWTDKRPTE